jgi:hypothetical protein
MIVIRFVFARVFPEAFVKRNGAGPSLELNRLDLMLRPERPVLLRVASTHEEGRRWSIAPIEVGGSCMGGILVEGYD